MSVKSAKMCQVRQHPGALFANICQCGKVKHPGALFVGERAVQASSSTGFHLLLCGGRPGPHLPHVSDLPVLLHCHVQPLH